MPSRDRWPPSFAARGIRVNTAAPGVVKTPTTTDADYERLAAQHPLGRMAEIGNIVQGGPDLGDVVLADPSVAAVALQHE